MISCRRAGACAITSVAWRSASSMTATGMAGEEARQGLALDAGVAGQSERRRFRRSERHHPASRGSGDGAQAVHHGRLAGAVADVAGAGSAGDAALEDGLEGGRLDGAGEAEDGGTLAGPGAGLAVGGVVASV